MHALAQPRQLLSDDAMAVVTQHGIDDAPIPGTTPGAVDDHVGVVTGLLGTERRASDARGPQHEKETRTEGRWSRQNSSPRRYWKLLRAATSSSGGLSCST